MTWLALFATPAGTVVALLLREPSQSGARALGLACSVLACAVVVVAEWRPRRLRPWMVVAACTVPLSVAVALAPQGSRDLWGYAAYGRVLVTYHESPYVHPPSEHGDPVIDRMPVEWRHTRAPYGPAFLAVAAAPSALGARSALATRLWFQGLAALAAGLGLLLLTRRGAGPGRLAVLALNPLVAVFVVNGGHNDLLVGVPVLAAVLAAERRRWVLAGAALGLAASVKVVGLLPLVVLVVWVWRRHRRPAWAVLGTAAGVLAATYAVAGGSAALAPLGAEAAQQSRASLWEAVCAWVLRSPRWFSGPSSGGLVHHWAPYAVAAVGAAAVVLVGSGRFGAGTQVSLGLLAYLLAAPYVLPWYLGWVLPVLALGEDGLSAAVGSGYAALLLLVYTDGAGYTGAAHLVLHTMAWLVAPVLELAALAAVLAVLTRARRRDLALVEIRSDSS